MKILYLLITLIFSSCASMGAGWRDFPQMQTKFCQYIGTQPRFRDGEELTPWVLFKDKDKNEPYLIKGFDTTGMIKGHEYRITIPVNGF